MEEREKRVSDILIECFELLLTCDEQAQNKIESRLKAARRILRRGREETELWK